MRASPGRDCRSFEMDPELRVSAFATWSSRLHALSSQDMTYRGTQLCHLLLADPANRARGAVNLFHSHGRHHFRLRHTVLGEAAESALVEYDAVSLFGSLVEAARSGRHDCHIGAPIEGLAGYNDQAMSFSPICVSGEVNLSREECLHNSVSRIQC